MDDFKIAHGVSQHFLFYMNPSDKIENKQFSEVDIKQSNISIIILLIPPLYGRNIADMA